MNIYDRYDNILATWAGYQETQKTPDPQGIQEVPGIPKTGRNDPCPCGSGKKYKKCCLSY